MAQGLLPFKYEAEKETTGMTALGGLPAYLDLAKVIGLSKSIQKHLKVREGGQGWTDSQVVLSIVLLNLAGGDCVEDIKVLESDDGFCEVLKKAEMHGLKRKVRRELLRRWRKERKRAVPSASAIFRYLAKFHDREQDKYREAGKAFIPEANEHLRGFVEVNKDLARFAGSRNIQDTATLDMDATLVATNKADSLFCYKGHKSYQPFNTWWAEQGIVLHTEFRDGNVPAGFEQLRVFKEALGCLPEEVKRVRLRSDTAGYQHDLLKYCASGSNDRFGVIEFAVGCDVTKEFKRAVAEVEESEWKPIYKEVRGKKEPSGVEWAEVCFVPNAIGHSKKGPEYRYLAKREVVVEQLMLSGMEQQISLPFPTMETRGKRYKIFGIATNMDWDGENLIHWHHERCGKSEEAHSVMKEDLAGGKLPSNDFGENAAWWWMMILALNLNAMMKMHVLGKEWEPKRMKAIRFWLINLPGRVVKRSRNLIIRLTRNQPALDVLLEARRKIAMLMPAGCG
ncbi:MAG: IS1380 family transposase [Chloroflexi bacterium]|nr:IS1380 family transposase [Chloroflexota bacterium]MBM4309069.1 IS1380 family transposase [Deltaproteobacteria bacterium]